MEMWHEYIFCSTISCETEMLTFFFPNIISMLVKGQEIYPVQLQTYSLLCLANSGTEVGTLADEEMKTVATAIDNVLCCFPKVKCQFVVGVL